MAPSGSEPETHWFVINLERSTERLATITRTLSVVGVDFTRVPAVDGRRLSFPLPGIDPDRYRRTHGRDVRLTEIGCYMSHLRALRTFLDTPHLYAMVLEDDAVVTPESVRLVERLTAIGAPDDWDMVKFEAHHLTVGLPIRAVSGRYRLCVLPTRPTGAAAYLVNRAAASAILGALLPMRVPYDHAYDRAWALHLRVRAILPLPIDVRHIESTISPADNPARKVRLGQKGPSLLWRARTETLRALCALHAWAFPSRRFPWPGVAPTDTSLYDAMERAIAASIDQPMMEGSRSAP